MGLWGIHYFESNSKLFVDRRRDCRRRDVTTSNGRNDRIDWFSIRHYRFYSRGLFRVSFDKVKSRATIERSSFVTKQLSILTNYYGTLTTTNYTNSIDIMTPIDSDLYRREPRIVFVLKFCGKPTSQHVCDSVSFKLEKKRVIRTQQCLRTARGARRALGPWLSPYKFECRPVESQRCLVRGVILYRVLLVAVRQRP